MINMYKVIYNYNNASYSITDTEEIHKLLETVREENREENTFARSTKSTKLFLEAYSKRKSLFRDPKIKKERLCQEIAQILKTHGYTNIDEDILDCKMRNMKRSYKIIKENYKKTSTGRGRMSWEYFDTFENIFADDKTINPDNTLESTINIQETLDACQSTTESVENEGSSTSAASTNTISTSTTLTSNTAQSVNTLSDITNFNPALETCLDSPSTSNISNNNSTSSSMPKKKSLYNQRKKQLEIEQERIQAIIELKESLEENNKIQKERNDLIKQFLQSQLR